MKEIPRKAEAATNSKTGPLSGEQTTCTSARTEPVGYSAANAFGLHDLHGNVWEWVVDRYVGSYSGAPTGNVSDCRLRVVRGGSWGSGPRYLRSAIRGRGNTAVRGNSGVGFRVARTL